MVDRFAAAGVFQEIASLLAIKGENPFKIQAYDRAADSLLRTQAELPTLVDEDRLGELPGVGAGLSARLRELVQTGHLTYLDRLRDEIPPGVVEMAREPMIGRSRAMLLLRALDITSASELEEACRTRRVREVRGIGPRIEARLLEGARRIQERGAARSRRSLPWSARVPRVQMELPLSRSSP